MGIFEKIRKAHGTEFIEVNSRKCVACWACLEACPKGVFSKIDFLGHRHIKIKNPDNCIGCNKCVRACTHGALTAKTLKAPGKNQSAK